MNVIVRTSEGAVSLLVDEIGDVVEVDESTFEEPPETATGRAREFILGVFKLDQRLLLILDTTKAVRLSGEAASTRTDDRRRSPDRSDERAA
jgi:purine-binding chemotaxis protein CheW